MVHKAVIIGVLTLFSSSAFSLDLQREELLNLYHGIESGQVASVAKEWVNLSTGIAANYQQGNEYEEIQFAPLPADKENNTEIGVFSNESLNDSLTNGRAYEFESPTRFGHNESESYGVYIRKSF